MKKIITHSVLLLLLACLPAVAQNTATTSGNWDNCATWGNPTSIFNVTTDTKTINTGVAIVQNTTWSTNNVNFGTGNGSVSFADATKSIDFVTDAGADKTCVTPAVSSINCATGVLTGTLTSQTVASGVSQTVPYTGGNGGSYPADAGTASTGVTGLTATLRAGTLASGSGNLVYDITGTPSGSGTASFAISFAGRSCTMTITVGVAILFDNNGFNCTLVSGGGWVLSGSWQSAKVCDPGVQPACYLSGDNCSNSTIGSGMAYKTVATVAGRTYTVRMVTNHNGLSGTDGYGTHTQTQINVYGGTATSGTAIATRNTGNGTNSAGYVTTFTFVAAAGTTSTTFKLTETGTTSAGDQQSVTQVKVTY